MILARVQGTVVADRRNDSITGARYLLTETCALDGKALGEWLIAIDLLGAGVEEVVLISQGSSARQTTLTNKKPIDAVIVGIVDTIEESGSTVFRKQNEARDKEEAL